MILTSFCVSLLAGLSSLVSLGLGEFPCGSPSQPALVAAPCRTDAAARSDGPPCRDGRCALRAAPTTRGQGCNPDCVSQKSESRQENRNPDRCCDESCGRDSRCGRGCRSASCSARQAGCCGIDCGNCCCCCCCDDSSSQSASKGCHGEGCCSQSRAGRCEGRLESCCGACPSDCRPINRARCDRGNASRSRGCCPTSDSRGCCDNHRNCNPGTRGCRLAACCGSDGSGCCGREACSRSGPASHCRDCGRNGDCQCCCPDGCDRRPADRKGGRREL